MRTTILLLTLFSLTPLQSHAAVRRIFQDLKLPTQVVMEKQTITDPAAGNTVLSLTDSAGNTSAAAATVSSFSAQPDVARNLVLTPTGTTDDVAACDVVVNGTDYLNDPVSETFTLSANQSTAVTGSKAFKTVSSVVFPAGCEDAPYGATWSLGTGVKLGLKRCMDSAGHVVFATMDGVYEATRPTVTAGNTVVSSNTATFNTAPNGSRDYEVFFLQNYRCK